MPVSSFDRLFSDADGLLGSVFLDSAAPTLSKASLHRLVVVSGLIETSQARATYGHWRTKTQCKADPTLRYWKSLEDLPAYLAYKSHALNPTTLTPMKPRLDVLRSEPVGFILLVTTIITTTNAPAPGPPIITIVAAPSMANIGSPDPIIEPGILFEDIWSPSVLVPFEKVLTIDAPHCPVLAASEGFSRAIPSPTPQLYLEDAKPLFFPSGELLCGTVEIGPAGSTYRSFFLPEICSPPLGLVWPTNVSFDDFKESIRALGLSYRPFLHLLTALEPQLQKWFPAVSAHPDTFTVPSCPYLEEMVQAFPSLIDGTYPPSITDSRGFSPLADMRYGLFWRLHCDHILAMTVGPGHQHFSTYLQRGTAGITATTYLGAAIPGRFCPNFGFHFKPHNNKWPTDSHPTEHFSAEILVSLDARDYEAVTIEVHGDRWAPIPSLLTRDQLSTQRHRNNTPRQSRAPPVTTNGDPVITAPAPQPDQLLPPATDPNQIAVPAHHPFDPFDGQTTARTPIPPAGNTHPPTMPLPGMNQPFIPPQVQPFSPPPIRPHTQSLGTGDTPFTHSARALFPQPSQPLVSQQSIPHTSSHSSRRFDYERASLENEATRRAANMEFLSVCLLLSHTSPNYTLFDPVNRRPIPPEQNLFPREPCHHARREILSYIDLSRPDLPHNSGRTYLAGILSANGIDFQQAYRGSYFTNKFFSSIINVESWLVSPHASPLATQTSNAIPSLHLFDFLSCISSISHGKNLLPTNGLTPLQARHVGNLIYYCFASFDIKEDFKTCPFSLLS
jgi:hypothetical protein